MAKKKTKSTNDVESIPLVSMEKKKKLIGIFLSVLALLILLSILSYTRSDEANLAYNTSDMFRVFSADPDFAHRADSTANWLGIFGAYMSYFLINSTIGYFSIIFPVILFVWGYSITFNENFKIAVHLSNFFTSIGVILASFFGMLRYELGVLQDVNELSGKVGAFFGSVMGRLFGGLGSIIFIFFLLFVVIFISFDIKIESIVEYIKEKLSKLFADSENPEKEVTKKDNLEKIIKLGKRKKEVDNTFIGDLPHVEEPVLELEPETKIRIIKKNTDPLAFTDEKLEEPEIDGEKKVVLDDDEEPQIDVVLESTYPEQWEEKLKYEGPTYELLSSGNGQSVQIPEAELKRNAELLKEKLALFDIVIEDISVTPGPVVTLYELVPAPGVKISKIVSLENDIALALAARGIRIIAPIPGKSAIGVEIPNAKASLVTAKSVISKTNEYNYQLPLALGKTISGETYVTDLATMPHMLIAGSTGSGKSVGINMIITSLIYAKHPSDIKFVIIDPKKIELSFYKRLNKHFLAVSPDLDEEIITSPTNALLALKAVEYEMEKRYDKLAKAGVRNIVDYNEKVANPKRKPKDTEKMVHHKLPYIVVIIDELADLMLTAGKEVEEPITRLAQLARAVGIHLIVATQRPSVNVITGVIKANFSCRMAFQVASKIDSRTILDMNGAEQLLGKGDMLFLPGGMPKPIRIQSAFITTDEVEAITNHIYVQKGFSKRYFLPSMYEKKQASQGNFLGDLDPMFEDAARVIVRHQQGSVSLLQRRLKLGYSRAARIVDQLEEAGVVGPSEGSKARTVQVETEQELETILKSL
ncbi:MAG: DNA translocase FtsK [Bacteroidetes bacterium]|nr:DNA translocase FtsK [Bacteroidota bacterium]